MNDEIIEIIEGGTKLLVPKGSMTEKVPPKEPAFFNPRASLSRDLSIIACSASVSYTHLTLPTKA